MIFRPPGHRIQLPAKVPPYSWYCSHIHTVLARHHLRLDFAFGSRFGGWFWCPSSGGFYAFHWPETRPSAPCPGTLHPIGPSLFVLGNELYSTPARLQKTITTQHPPTLHPPPSTITVNLIISLLLVLLPIEFGTMRYTFVYRNPWLIGCGMAKFSHLQYSAVPDLLPCSIHQKLGEHYDSNVQ